MILNNLKISKNNGDEIRNISFRKGVNIIVNKDGGKSGNNIGKTTLSRSIDFCFGSEGIDIYKDKEFKKDNPNVKDFLELNNIIFELNFSLSGESHKIIRSFKNDTLVIDDIDFSENSNSKSNNLNDFRDYIYKNFFFLGDKISGRFFLKKFIRNNSNNKENTLKFLPDRTKEAIYEYLHLFLFRFSNINLLSENFLLSQDIAKINNEKKILNRRYGNTTLKKAELSLSKINKELDEKNNIFDELKIRNFFDNSFNGIEKLKKEISELSTTKAIFESKIISIKSNLDFLSKKKFEQNINDLKDLYENAKINVDSISKTFENLVIFHNQMLDSKITYLNKQLITLKSELFKINPLLNNLLKQEEEIIKILGTNDYLEDIKLMAKSISSLSEKKGEFSKIVDSLTIIEADLENKQREKDIVDNEIKNLLKILDENIKIFNDIFSEYSEKIYGESSGLFYDMPEGRRKYYKFYIDSLGNEGTGKKKGQISTFDLAYIKFLDTIGDVLPRFIIYDGIEEIDSPQIKDIFDISESLNGQYIVGVLYDKIKDLGDDYLKDKIRLELSEDEKFFKF